LNSCIHVENVSHFCIRYRERGCTGDRELSWSEVDSYVAAARGKEEQLRARLSAISGSKQLDSWKKASSSQHLQDELTKEHASLAAVVLLDSKVSELRKTVHDRSEMAAKQYVIVWSRWSENTSAHTPPEPPLIGKRFSVSFFQKILYSMMC
jgi:hypothetical protein